MTTAVRPSNGKYITLEDIEKEVVLSDDIHFAPTRVISLENTIGGVIMPLSEIALISEFAKAHGIKVHLDGARLWNACSVPGAPELHEYAAVVDSLSVCFSKSLGAPVGSFVVGEERLVEHARHVRKAIGGGIRQAGVLTAMAEVALDEVWGGGLLEVGNGFAKRLEVRWRELGGGVTLPVDTNMVWLDLGGRGVEVGEWVEEARRQGVIVGGARIVCHYRESGALSDLDGIVADWRWEIENSTEGIEKLEKAMEEVCRKADRRKQNGVEDKTNKKTGVKRKTYQQ